MSSSSAASLDVARISFDLKLCAEVVSEFTGLLEPDAIASKVTAGLVDTFGCAFARVWLVEPDRTALRLVASSGLYTRLDGSFARVPMGHFKIGKIAQNGIPFLSNCLPKESWVKDREWAVSNNIQGFAGLPLMANAQTIGVLAVFSTQKMDPGFLEVLQMFSLCVAAALVSALNHQKAIASVALQKESDGAGRVLSEALADLFGQRTLSLLGTERAIDLKARRLFVDLATRLEGFSCRYCRLIYEDDSVVLETMLAVVDNHNHLFFTQVLENISELAKQLNGGLMVESDSKETVVAIRLELPQKGMAADGLLGEHKAEAEKEADSGSPLSEREREVMVLLANGLRDRDIAQRLFISERTVKFHAKNMLTKLAVRTRVQAVFEATKRGWLT